MLRGAPRAVLGAAGRPVWTKTRPHNEILHFPIIKPPILDSKMGMSWPPWSPAPGPLYDVGKGRERGGDARERAKENGLLSSPSFLSLRMRTSSAPVATTAQHSRSPPPALTTTAHARAPLLAGRRAIGPGPRHHCSGHTDKSPWTRAPSQILALAIVLYCKRKSAEIYAP